MKRLWLVFLIIITASYKICLVAQVCNDIRLSVALDEIKLHSNKKQVKIGLHKCDSLIRYLQLHNDTTCYSFYKLKRWRGLLLIRDDKLGDAIIQITDLLHVVKSTSYKDLEAHAYLSLALIDELNRRQESCKKNLDYALEIIKQYDLKEPYIRYNIRKASYERIFLQNKKNCLKFAKEALNYKDYVNNINDLADTYFLLYTCSDDPIAKNEFRKKSIETHFIAKDYMGSFYLSTSICNELIDAGKINEANQFLDSLKFKFLDVIEENSIEKLDGLSIYYAAKKEVYKKMNNLKDALKFADLYNDAVLERMSKENEKNLTKFQEEYLFEKEHRKSNLLAQRNDVLKSSLVIAIISSAFLLFLLYYIYKNRLQIKAQKETIEKSIKELSALNQKNEMLLSEVHHRVKNSLQNAISLLHLKEGFESDEHIKKSLQNTSNRIHCIALIHEHLYQSQDFEYIHVKGYLRNILSLYSQLTHQLKSVNFVLDVYDHLYLNFDTMMPLGIITNELISNSLKHAKQPGDLEIKLSIQSMDKTKFKFIYSDNGIKADSVQKPKMGRLLISSMIRQLNSKIEDNRGYDLSFIFSKKETAKL